MQHNNPIDATRQWLATVVVGLNLCPFASRELTANRVRFVETAASSEEQVLMALEAELQCLKSDASIETILLIHPDALQDFHEYNQFLNLADGLLEQMSLDGIFQIASFHPDYQFGGTELDDVENCTNRSPYPMLHIIREDSLEAAIENFPDVSQIPVRNIERMKRLGKDKMQKLLEACFDKH